MGRSGFPRWVGLVAVVALLLSPGGADGQSRTVSGQVREAGSQAAVAGATVRAVGATTSALTDADGAFSLSIPSGVSTVRVSGFGYRTVDVPVEARLSVELEIDPLDLEGITVVPLVGAVATRNVGHAAYQLSGDEIALVPEYNLLESLQGVVPGARIVSTSSTAGTVGITLRGYSSISGRNEPLILVDGVPIDNASPRNRGRGDLSANDAVGASLGQNPTLEGIDWGSPLQDLNPADIQSVDVMPGPNAAAAYGSRAANGAILITTKSGRGGDGVTATTTLTFEQPLKLPSYQNLYGQGWDGVFSFGDGAGGGSEDFRDQSWGPRLDGTLVDQFTGAAQPWIARPDNVRSFFRTGSTWDTNVSVARSGEAGHVRLSLGNTEISGMAPGEEIDRVALTVRGGTDLSDRVSAEASVRYTRHDAFSRMGTGYDLDNPMHGFLWFGRQVDVDALRDYRCTGDEPTPCDLNGGQFNWIYAGGTNNNPFWEQLVNTNEQRRDRLFGAVSTKVQITDWLTATGVVGNDWYRERRRAIYAQESQEFAGAGAFAESVIYASELNLDAYLTASRVLTPTLTLDVTAGANLRDDTRQTNNATVTALTVPGIYSIDNAAVPVTATDYVAEKRVVGAYGVASLGYRDYLDVTVTGRNDWSSTLPAANRSYFYPSVSSSLIFTDAFDLSGEILTSGKVRASWTRVGNDAEPYQLEAVLAAQQPFGALPLFSTADQLANGDLKPEETTAWEVGTDLSFLDDRVGLSATYYLHHTRNQILPAQISPTSGYTAQLLNAGDIRNAGVELLLRGMPLRDPDGLSWGVDVTWSRNRSEVVELHGDLESILLGGSLFGMSVEAREGEPYGTLYGAAYLRCDDAAVTAGDCAAADVGELLLDVNGMPQGAPALEVLGNFQPDWIGGIRNTFQHGPYSLSVLVDGQKGGDVFSLTNWLGEYSGVLESTTRGRDVDFCDPGIVVRGVLPDLSFNGDGVADQTVCPREFFQNNLSYHEAAVFDASYVKLRELRIGYRLPDTLMGRLGFSGGDVALVGRNLFLWSNAPNIDPETAFDASNVQGLEFGQAPTPRSLGFSLTLRP